MNYVLKMKNHYEYDNFSLLSYFELYLHKKDLEQQSTPNIKDFKHKSERLLIIFGYITTGLSVFLAIIAVYLGIELNTWVYLVFIGLLYPIFGRFILNFIYYKKITDAIEVSKNQLPELYEVYKNVALKLGFTEDTIPPLYVVYGYGIKKILSSKSYHHENYIIIKNDIANMIYDENPNIKALNFILANHLAYIKCQYTSIRYMVIYPIMRLLFLYKLLSKSQQFTADRLTCYYYPDCIDAIINLHLSYNLSPKVNQKEYFKDLEKYDNSLFLKLSNIISDGLPYRRMQALKEAQTKGWNVHGKLF